MLKLAKSLEWDGANCALREALDVPDGTHRAQHEAIIESIRKLYSHAVVFRELGRREVVCLPYALGLGNHELYFSVIEAVKRRDLTMHFVGTEFVRWLRPHLIEIDSLCDGCLALFFEADRWLHAGQCIGSKIRSKWGEFPVYEHPLWEIPIRYGDRLRCYEMPSNAMELFTTYAHMRGI